MSNISGDEIARLSALRLPELQARFAEVVGETSRCPNKKWLVRRIGETLAKAGSAESPRDPASAASDGEQPAGEAVPLRRLSVAELQSRHLEVIGRPTRSTHAGYLKWRLRQAERGRIRVGAARGLDQDRDGAPADFKVLPFRMKATLVARLDEARERLGFESRAGLLLRALHDYLVGAGESELAESLLGDRSS